MATSGCSAGIRASADAAVPASPTTWMSGWASSSSRTPSRTISWSSSRKTPIVLSPGPTSLIADTIASGTLKGA